ncbi:MAG: zinc-binding dehydrogenase [Chloroflexi bacterium]|nr:zinc-binding dehydrogenase [Chloroflexota bacterium]
MANKSKAAVLEAPRKMVLRQFPLPQIGDRDFLLKVELVSICGGDPIEYEGRNVKTHYPLILGHEMVGTVVEVGEHAARRYGIQVGDRVNVEPYILCGECRYCLTGYYQFCERSSVYGVNISCAEPPYLWGAYAEYMYGAPGSRVHKLDPQVPLEAGVMTSVLGNGVRWIRTLGKVRFGESVVVVGPGAQGMATVIAAKESGAAPVIVVGRTRNPAKWDLIREFGADHLVDLAREVDPIGVVSDILGGQLADVVVECSGAAEMMQLGLELARPVGRYVLTGTCGYEKVSLITDLIVFKELQILGGLGQSWDTEVAARLINSRRYAIEKMITHVFPLERADEAIRFFMEKRGEVIRVAIKP